MVSEKDNFRNFSEKFNFLFLLYLFIISEVYKVYNPCKFYLFKFWILIVWFIVILLLQEYKKKLEISKHKLIKPNNLNRKIAVNVKQSFYEKEKHLVLCE